MLAEDFKVFISYAHADNQSVEAETPGWVSNFVDHLKNDIARRPGGGRIECWMDHRLEPQRAVDAELRQRILESQCFLAFLSPRYLESVWCQQEMATFVETVGGGKADDRVFLVELLPTKREDWHSGIQSITELKFWHQELAQPEPMTLAWPVANPKSDTLYWNRINALASILARQIQHLPVAPPTVKPQVTPTIAPTPAIALPAKAQTVWVADPTDDVLEQWESLAGRLQQQGYAVLPKFVGSYPTNEETSFRQALNADLDQAQCLVQLLGSLSGRKPAWADISFVQLQAEAADAVAKRSQLSWFSWRAAEINLDAIADPGLKSLLAAATAISFEDFYQLLIQHLSAPPPAPAVSSGQLSVVINADQPDRDLGKQAQHILDQLEVDSILAAEPTPTQAPAQYFQHLENILDASHGVLIVYGKAPPSWVQAQHAFARKRLAERRKGVWEALLDGPPPDKPEHGLSIRDLLVLDCRQQGLSPGHLQEFVEKLRQGVGHV